jgi:hypothetical protein
MGTLRIKRWRYAMVLIALSSLARAQLSTIVPAGMTQDQVDAAIQAQSSERLLLELATRRINSVGAPCDIPQTASVGVIACFLPYGVLVGKVRPGTSAILFNFDGSQVAHAFVQGPDQGLSPGGGFFAQIPPGLQDGRTHDVQAYAVLPDGTQLKFDVADVNGNNFNFTWAPSGAASQSR